MGQRAVGAVVAVPNLCVVRTEAATYAEEKARIFFKKKEKEHATRLLPKNARGGR